MSRLRPKLTYANVMATVAVFIALGGASYAALKLPKNSVGPKQLKKNAVTTAKIKKEAVTAGKVKQGTLTGVQINSSTLGTVPTAQTANSLAPSEGWHEVGAPNQPGFHDGWNNLPSGLSRETVGFYKGQDGVVHLKGVAKSGTGVIFNLPPGYRPVNQRVLLFPVSCGCGTQDTGTVIIEGPGLASGHEGAVDPPSEATSVSLDGITFRAES